MLEERNKRCERTTPFLEPFYTQNARFNPDRIGTNIGKVENQRCFVQARLGSGRGGRAESCSGARTGRPIVSSKRLLAVAHTNHALSCCQRRCRSYLAYLVPVGRCNDHCQLRICIQSILCARYQYCSLTVRPCVRMCVPLGCSGACSGTSLASRR